MKNIIGASGSSRIRPGSKLYRAAQWYVEHGFAIFPLMPKSKKPMTPHGFHDATVDPDKIVRWWAQVPDANIGLALGAADLLLIDMDQHPASASDDSSAQLSFDFETDNSSDDIWRTILTNRLGDIPTTAEVCTGNGHHYYFRYRGGDKPPKNITKNIELKAAGSYAVVPPSIHPTGFEYCFLGSAGLDTLLVVADLPPTLYARISSNIRLPMTPERKWYIGERNTGLTTLAGLYWYKGVLAETLTAKLLEANQNRCIPPLSENEVRRIATSITRYPRVGFSHRPS
jgi:hypothetical protein